MKVYQEGCLMVYIVGKKLSATKAFYFFLNAGLDCKVSCNLKVLKFSTTTGLKKNSKTSTI
jgi:hypothetical protein